MPAKPPSHREVLWPCLEAVRALGGSGRIDEIDEKAIEIGGFTEEQQSILHGQGPRTELEYRLALARTSLKKIGALDNSERGVWSITEKGRMLSSEDEVRKLYAQWLRESRRRSKETEREQLSLGSQDGEGDWKQQLLEVVLGLSPDRFERLARRLLLEAGFVRVKVTGRSGDGGIDGLGVYRLSLVSFPIFFQCKRYRGSVRAGAVRDFRGAMSGRGDKGLLITTGTFTAEARREATREGAPPIDLIDGERLCELLREYRLGVRTATRTVEEVEVDATAFEDV